jgi:putative hemolysin
LYEGDIDNIIGIINFKDMAKVYATMDYKNLSLKDIARKAYFVPDTQNIDVLFEDMKVKKNLK